MRVVVVTLAEKGHYFPLLGTVLELSRRGHDVVMTSTSDIADELRRAGVPRVVIPAGAAPPPDGVRGEALARVLRDPVALAGWIRELLVEAPRRGVEPLRRVLRELRPDVVAIDTMAYDGAIAAELEGVPWVGLATSLNPVVPDGPDRQPAFESELIRTTAALPRRELFAEHGITDVRFRVSDVLSPRGTAVFASEDFVRPVGLPRDPTVHLVGPSIGGERGGEVVDPSFAAGRPIVYVSFGSQAWYQPRRFERIFSSADRLGVAVIAAMGELAEAFGAMAGIGRRHRCVRFAAQLEALRDASAAITHGGAGSVMECAALGVPMIVSPICNDQPHSARFVVAAGCGVELDLETCSDAELDRALERAVGDAELQEASARLADAGASRDGSVGAAELIERAGG